MARGTGKRSKTRLQSNTRDGRGDISCTAYAIGQPTHILTLHPIGNSQKCMDHVAILFYFFAYLEYSKRDNE